MNASLISHRASAINGSGIRRVFDLGSRLPDPINLSIGQPDFPVPDSIKQAAVQAILNNDNGYTPTRGIKPLLEGIAAHLRTDLGWDIPLQPVPTDLHCGVAGGVAGPVRPDLLVTSGTSGGLVLAAMALLNPGDELIVPDPWFVLYPHLAELCNAKAVACDTYPDFRLTAARVAPLITSRTKAVILCSPGNPSGVVATPAECADLLALCESRGIMLISDEIYDEFTFSESLTDHAVGDASRVRCPSPARIEGSHEHCLLIRGFGKSYGVTGWRLGYAAGPRWLIAEMVKLQQYLYVCVPTPLQHGAAAALHEDLSPMVREYQGRRDMVLSRLGKVTEVAFPGGAFYAFVKVPERLGLTASQFFERAYAANVLIVPGKTFSNHDTHFRLSFATKPAKLDQGLDILGRLLAGDDVGG